MLPTNLYPANQSSRPAPDVVVCERSGRWAVSLGRELAGSGLRLHQTRSLSECERELSAARSSLLVVELDAANARELPAWLARCAGRFPAARAVVVAERRWRNWQWLVREAGAVHFEVSPRRLAAVAAIARRQATQGLQPSLSAHEALGAASSWNQP